MATFRNTLERFGDTTTVHTAESPESLATEVNDLFVNGALNDWYQLDESDESKDEFCTRRALQLREEFIDGLEEVPHGA